MIKETECRNEEKNRHGKPGRNFEKRDEREIRRRVREILGADVNADDAEHGNAANILNGGNTEVFSVHDYQRARIKSICTSAESDSVPASIGVDSAAPSMLFIIMPLLWRGWNIPVFSDT